MVHAMYHIIVLWTAILVIGGKITFGVEMSLLDGVSCRLRQRGSESAGLHPDRRGWRLSWLPTLYIIAALSVAAFIGLPRSGVTEFLPIVLRLSPG